MNDAQRGVGRSASPAQGPSQIVPECRRLSVSRARDRAYGAARCPGKNTCWKQICFSHQCPGWGPRQVTRTSRTCLSVVETLRCWFPSPGGLVNLSEMT